MSREANVTPPLPNRPARAKRRFGCGQVLLIMAITALVTAGITAWWVKRHLYASHLKPVELTTTEEATLTEKLERIEEAAIGDLADAPKAPPERETPMAGELNTVEPEAYTEDDARREIELTERELNALIAKNYPDLADKLAVDLARNLVSVKLIAPMDPDVPFVGGKTLRLKLGLAMRYADNQASVALKGISLGGIPLPNAWIGDLKNKDLVQEFGEEGGFWKRFSDGIEDLEITNGGIRLKLKP